MSDTGSPLRPHVRPDWPDYFDPAMWFTFLMRSDVRGNAPPGDEEARKRFLVWFFCFGRRQYLSGPLSDRQRALLWESVPFATASGSWTVPRLLAYVLTIRRDVFLATRADEPGGPQRALGWLFLHGLDELDLHDALDGGVRGWLNAPAAVPAAASPIGGGDTSHDAVPVTNLGMLVWAFREDLHERHDLSTAEGRRRFMGWLYSGGPGAEALRPLLPGTGTVERRVEAAGPPDGAGGPVKRGCNLVGYAYGELGVGEDVRMMAAALQANAVPFSIADRSAGLDSRTNDRSAAGHVAEGLPHNVTVFCFTGFDTVHFFLEKGAEAMRGRHVVGYWPWELPRWPAEWRAAFGLVDEIWVSSRFTQEAFCLDAPVPVIYMPMAVEIPPPAPLARRDFGLPDGVFLFLYVFDAHSYLDRKNPLAAVQAFRRAFPRGDEPVGLVLKVMNAAADNPLWQETARQCAADPRIRVIAATLDKPQALGLVRVCDAYLSLHRSEGFGRTIAEAMLLERPVIATAWSGSDELVRPDTAIPVPAALVPVGPGQYPWGEGMHWADPDLEQAAWSMRLLVGDAALRARLGVAGRDFVRLRHNARTVGQRYRERLAALGLI